MGERFVVGQAGDGGGALAEAFQRFEHCGHCFEVDIAGDDPDGRAVELAFGQAAVGEFGAEQGGVGLGGQRGGGVIGEAAGERGEVRAEQFGGRHLNPAFAAEREVGAFVDQQEADRGVEHLLKRGLIDRLLVSAFARNPFEQFTEQVLDLDLGVELERVEADLHDDRLIEGEVVGGNCDVHLQFD